MAEFQDLSGQSIVRAGMDKRLYLSIGVAVYLTLPRLAIGIAIYEIPLLGRLISAAPINQSFGLYSFVLLLLNAVFPLFVLLTKKYVFLVAQGGVLLLQLLLGSDSLPKGAFRLPNRLFPDGLIAASWQTVGMQDAWFGRGGLTDVLILVLSILLIVTGVVAQRSPKPAGSMDINNFGMPRSNPVSNNLGGQVAMESSDPTSSGGGADTSQPNNSAGHASPGAMFGADVRFIVQMFGADDRSFSYVELQQMSQSGLLKPATMVQQVGSTFLVPASSIPGVFSEKSATTAILLGFFFGYLGVDRFYLGYTGLGVLKLLTLGGCGIWALIDIILIASRKVKDSDGRPLV